MIRVRRLPVPEHALHRRHAEPGGHADAYSAVLSRAVTLPELVEAFYTCRLFKLERWVLACTVGKASTDAQARALAAGVQTGFAAWE